MHRPHTDTRPERARAKQHLRAGARRSRARAQHNKQQTRCPTSQPTWCGGTGVRVAQRRADTRMLHVAPACCSHAACAAANIPSNKPPAGNISAPHLGFYFGESAIWDQDQHSRRLHRGDRSRCVYLLFWGGQQQQQNLIFFGSVLSLSSEMD